MSQLELLPVAERRAQGRALAERAIAQVEEHNAPDAERLFEAGWRVARKFEEFTSDDIWDEFGNEVVREPRVMGPVMRRLGAAGIAEATGRLRPAHRGINHVRPQQLWRSCIY